MPFESGAETASFAPPAGALPGNPQLDKPQRDDESGNEKTNTVSPRSGPDAFARDSDAGNGADASEMLDIDGPMSFSVLSSGRDGAPLKMGADEVNDFDRDNAESRPAIPLAVDARLQATAIQLAGSSPHTADDANSQRPGEDTVFASSTIGLAPTVKASLNARAVGGSTEAKPTGTVSDAWASLDTRHDTTLDTVALAAAAHRLLRHGGAGPPDAAPPETEWPWRWTLALPLAPRLSIDAERLGQALEAVLADIDELGGKVADSLIDGDRFFWALVAGGAACYVAGAHDERVPRRRLGHDGSTRYIVAR